MCIPHSINCTPRDSALYSKATKRTISVESLRGDWIYWIYPIGFRSIVFLNIGWWMAIICFFFFFPVCVSMETKDFFVLELSSRDLRFFFLSRIFCEKFTVNLFCSFVCVGNEFFSFFLFVQSVKRVASRFMEFFFLVFE